MDSEMAFGQWLRKRRKALDLTQEDLGEHVGCSADTIRKIEAGERRPSKQVAELLADFLKISSEERSAFVQAARAEPDAPEQQANIPTNLPTPPTAFIGRERELTSV